MAIMMIRGATDYRNCQALTHPALNIGGKRNRMLGRGAFGRVYLSSNPDRVLKVTTDYYSYAALTDDVAKLAGKHFPKVFHDYGEIGTLMVHHRPYAIYMVEMERLYTDCNAMRDLPSWIYRRVDEFVQAFGSKPTEDIHQNNVMRRKQTGDAVLVDPVCDTDQLYPVR